jgi:cytidine deaminase
MKRVSKSDLSAEDRELLEAATKAREKAYAPYTRHRVGAAVRAESGKIYAACSLEIVSLQQSVHGERNAVNMMVAGGDRIIGALVCAGQLSGIPCAECRQVIWEFCGNNPNVPIICAGIDGIINVTTIGELYPFPYGPESKQVDPRKF